MGDELVGHRVRERSRLVGLATDRRDRDGPRRRARQGREPLGNLLRGERALELLGHGIGHRTGGRQQRDLLEVVERGGVGAPARIGLEEQGVRGLVIDGLRTAAAATRGQHR